MQGMVVPKDSFPLRRKTKCCGKECKAGESVIVIQYMEGPLERNMLLHRRCLVELIEELPLDAQDYVSLFTSIRDTVKETGKAVPDFDLVRNRNGGSDTR